MDSCFRTAKNVLSIGAVLAVFCYGCVHSDSETESASDAPATMESRSVETTAAANVSSAPALAQEASTPAPISVVETASSVQVNIPPAADCYGLGSAEDPQALPYFVKQHHLMITDAMKPCSLGGGKRGVEPKSQVVVMGFPCSAGSGRMEWKGHYDFPKMLSFHLANDCPMLPSQSPALDDAVASAGLPSSTKVVVHNPFAVQYWEIKDIGDADVGYVVDLRSMNNRRTFWKSFVAKETAITVKIFGRENAWTQNDRFYEVEGEIRLTGRSTFVFDVKSAKVMNAEEMDVVRKRCEALRPARDCASAF